MAYLNQQQPTRAQQSARRLLGLLRSLGDFEIQRPSGIVTWVECNFSFGALYFSLLFLWKFVFVLWVCFNLLGWDWEFCRIQTYWWHLSVFVGQYIINLGDIVVRVLFWEFPVN